jgi:ankyrin repeat protein
MAASQYGQLEIVKLLIAKGVNVNDQIKYSQEERNLGMGFQQNDPPDGATALILAAQNGHLEVLKLLIAKGADVNAKTKDGKTALILALKNVRQIIKEPLLKAGAK